MPIIAIFWFHVILNMHRMLENLFGAKHLQLLRLKSSSIKIQDDAFSALNYHSDLRKLELSFDSLTYKALGICLNLPQIVDFNLFCANGIYPHEVSLRIRRIFLQSFNR